MSSTSFEIVCSITLDEVPDIRMFVEKLHRRVVRDEHQMSRLALTTHELLENAVKFSADGSASLRIEFVEKSHVMITTRNRARTTDLADLLSIAAEIKAVSDPMMFYIGLMKRAPNARGGLGLGRVIAEGEMEIGFELDGDVVEVRAKSLAEPLA
jgi:hypothetical protein